MHDPKSPTLFLLLLALVISGPFVVSSDETDPSDDADTQLHTYIIHVKHPEDVHIVHLPEVMEGWYTSLLVSSGAFSPSTELETRIVHSYTHAMTGFAARLTKQELAQVSKADWFLNAYEDRPYALHTTHSPYFLGLRPQTGLWSSSNSGEGVIIGVIDTGVTPEHPSFRDDGMPSPPSRWKGKCDPPVVCNKKLIGARAIMASGGTPADSEGHGTHTASTAAGAMVPNASVSDNAGGSAIGMAPRAHLAVYKVCGNGGCASSDIVAGIGAAIRDGCDVISLSLGSVDWRPFHQEPVAIGTFSAAQRGIFVSVSAGNDGPTPSTVRNDFPWGITVAASSMDRSIISTVRLGNDREFDGESLYQPKDFGGTMLGLVFAGDGHIPNGKFCDVGTLDGLDVKGKIVLCQRGGSSGRIQKGGVVKQAGGAGMILMNSESSGYSTIADAHELPASNVAYSDGIQIMDYINSTPNPTATFVFKGTILTTPRAPIVTSFSSRGPSLSSPGILKPDITAPGVSILAAWPSNIKPESENQAGRPVFNIISGTSMSCPHISGIAALIKAAHPDWSPAAIKSAIMTTAYTLDNKGDPIEDEKLLPADFFTTGAGHVNVTKAANPGLIYDTDPSEYVPFLCGLGYTDAQVSAIVNRTGACSTVEKMADVDLNYPSFSVTLGPTASNLMVWREVTSVDDADTTYTAVVEAPAGVSVAVRPNQLRFKRLQQRRRFSVEFQKMEGAPLGYAKGELRWVSDKHVVRSPISFKING